MTDATTDDELLAALEGLSMHWREEANAKPALAMAAASSDPEIVAAGTMVRRSSVQMAAVTPSIGTPAIPADPQP